MANTKSPNGFTVQVWTKDRPYSGIYGTDIASPLGRIAFVSLATAVGAPGQKPKFGLSLLVPKKEGLGDKSFENQKEFLVGIQKQCLLMAQDLWGDKAQDNLKLIKRQFLRNGDDESSNGKTYEGYPGNYVIIARNAMPLGHNRGWKILNPDKTVDSFESGMICRLTIQPYLNADGFSYALRAIKLIKDDGVRFGGAPDPSSTIDHLDEAVAAVSAAGATGFEMV